MFRQINVYMNVCIQYMPAYTIQRHMLCLTHQYRNSHSLLSVYIILQAAMLRHLGPGPSNAEAIVAGSLKQIGGDTLVDKSVGVLPGGALLLANDMGNET